MVGGMVNRCACIYIYYIIWQEKIHAHPYMVSKNLFVCLSVTKFDINYLRTGKKDWAKNFWGISLSKSVVQNFRWSEHT